MRLHYIHSSHLRANALIRALLRWLASASPNSSGVMIMLKLPHKDGKRFERQSTAFINPQSCLMGFSARLGWYATLVFLCLLSMAMKTVPNGLKYALKKEGPVPNDIDGQRRYGRRRAGPGRASQLHCVDSKTHEAH